MAKSKLIDTYIENAKPFAQPILKHLRSLIHKACPDVEETIKWGFPHFDYKGMMCSIAAFQEHCAFGFWKGAIIEDPHHIFDKARINAMGQFGRVTSLKDLPSDKIIIAYIKEAMRLNDENIKVPKKQALKKELLIPDDFLAAIRKKKKALSTFENFPYSKKKDYIDWITEAKQKVTREKRLTTAIEWLSEGKSRNWKYETC